MGSSPPEAVRRGRQALLVRGSAHRGETWESTLVGEGPIRVVLLWAFPDLEGEQSGELRTGLGLLS